MLGVVLPKCDGIFEDLETDALCVCRDSSLTVCTAAANIDRGRSCGRALAVKADDDDEAGHGRESKK